MHHRTPNSPNMIHFLPAAPFFARRSGLSSQACINVYTRQLAKQYPNIVINSCTPGWIATDLTAGMGASNPPEKGTFAPIKLLFESLSEDARGWYFGSDGLRSPLDRYRNPGDPEYQE